VKGVVDLVEQMRGGLIVSCQARGDNPLQGAIYMTAMARAAVMGGAAAIRAEGPDDVRAIVGAVTVPVIGLYKVDYPDSPVYITPTLRELEAVLAAGAPIVAVDGTARQRPGESLPELVARIHDAGRVAMADISTLEEALQAEAMGFDLVATTLSGYTPYSPQLSGPDLRLVEQCAARCRCPVIAEGRIGDPATAARALAAGAFAVTVGTAITDPVRITANFVRAMQS
jgi:N-acylglucosamine-6-phosphate 2-epimerase